MAPLLKRATKGNALIQCMQYSIGLKDVLSSISSNSLINGRGMITTAADSHTDTER
jgi:hypothetical protein